MWRKYAIISSLATLTLCLAGKEMIPPIGFAQVDSNTQYLVYLTSNDPQVVQQARTLVPDAFTGTLDSGVRVLQMGRYSNLNLAQRRAEELKQVGLPVDVAPVTTKLAAVGGADPFPVGGTFTSPPATQPPVTNDTTFPPVPTTTQPIVPVTAQEVTPLPGVPGSSEFSPPEQSIEINRSSTGSPQAIPLATPTDTVPAPVSVDPVVMQEKVTFTKRNRYFVIIPTTSEEVLAKVRNLSPSARFNATERGSFIEVQGYPERSSAEVMNKTLRQQGFDSRVVYF